MEFGTKTKIAACFIYMKNKIKNFERHDWAKLLIWICGILCLTTWTVSDLIPLFIDYTHNNVATEIDVIKGENVEKPNVAICIPYPSGSLSNVVKWLNDRKDARNGSQDGEPCMECEGLIQNGWDVWRAVTPEPDGYFSEDAVAAAIMNRLVQKPDRFSEILKINSSNFNWNEPIFDAIWKYFSCVSTEDMKYTVKSSNAFEEDRCVSFDFSQTAGITKEIADQLYDYLLSYIDLYLDLAASNLLLGPAETIRKEGRTMSIKGTNMCILVPPETMQETVVFKSANDPSPPPWKRSSRKPWCTVYYEGVLYAFIPDHQNIYVANGRAPGPGIESEDTSLQFSIDSRVHERRPNTGCIDHSTDRKRCLAEFQVKRVAENCGCIPFFYRHMYKEYANMSYCNAASYANCEKLLHVHYETYRSNCRNRCEYTFYEWSHYSRYFPAQDSQWSCRLNFTAFIDPFVEFKIIVRDSSEKFAAQVGGLINLYLGFSGLSICAVVVACIDYMKQWQQNKRVKAKTSDQMESTVSQISEVELVHRGRRDLSGYVTREEFQKMKDELLAINESLRKELLAGRSTYH